MKQLDYFGRQNWKLDWNLFEWVHIPSDLTLSEILQMVYFPRNRSLI